MRLNEATASAHALERSLRVLFQDEARFGRISDPRACWVPPGVRAAELKIPHHITIVNLPLYSLELNLAEHQWDERREKYSSNKVFDDLEAVFQHLIISIRRLHDDPQRIASLTGFDWIIRGS
jgi:hypothetical protein